MAERMSDRNKEQKIIKTNPYHFPALNTHVLSLQIPTSYREPPALVARRGPDELAPLTPPDG